MAGSDAEATQVVARYLQALKDPDRLVDRDLVAKLQHTLEEADDPLERVVLQQQLLDAQQVDVGPVEAAFVNCVRSWADAEGVSWAAFLREGVPARVLRRAGWRITRAQARTAA